MFEINTEHKDYNSCQIDQYYTINKTIVDIVF